MWITQIFQKYKVNVHDSPSDIAAFDTGEFVGRAYEGST